jgi:uncharacterized membrane protein YdbT with pleckstrin-like domain
MPYPKRLLNDYETVALDLHPHWWYFAQAVTWLVISVAAGITVRILLDGETEEFLTWLAIIAILVCCAWVFIRYLKWSRINFVITSDRIIFRGGVVAKKGIEIPLERVNNIHFEQSVFERLLGAGDLLIESGGEGGQQRFTDIRRPERVQNLIHSQMEVNETRMYQKQGLGGVANVATQLEQLEGLLERGTLTRDEFETQKRRLLEG